MTRNPPAGSRFATWTAGLVGCLLAGCAAGPDYVRPTAPTAPAFKELAGWKQAEPRDDEPRGRWWEIYNDPALDALQDQVDVSNQTLARAAAQFRQARALVDFTRAGLFPFAAGNVSITRAKSAGSSASSAARGATTAHALSLNGTWEPDVWGRVRRLVEADLAGAQASQADLEAVRLSIRSDLAQNYFQLRALDTQQQLFDDTVAAFETSLKLTRNRYDAGVVAKADVVQAEAQLKTTQAQALDVGVQRAQLEHAIALLVGRPPSDLTIPRAPFKVAPPAIPVGLPSQLLERRPDIAAAERRVAAANAQIGAAQAAYFPALTLSATAGFQSTSFAQWLSAPSRLWSLGSALAQTLFDAGARKAVNEQAVAAYDATVAAYRQTVLVSFQEVEDNLAALRILEEEALVQAEAVAASRQAVALALNQYKAGIVSYLNVITAQATALSNERAAVDILNRRLLASVGLIRALGGGWNR
jgi:NodT family efflux transporter outer membrane factor (OMF) lipoprotein